MLHPPVNVGSPEASGDPTLFYQKTRYENFKRGNSFGDMSSVQDLPDFLKTAEDALKASKESIGIVCEVEPDSKAVIGMICAAHTLHLASKHAMFSISEVVSSTERTTSSNSSN